MSLIQRPDINSIITITENEVLTLPLYSYSHGKKVVPEKSGLNQWNAAGRKRNPNEVYIPYLATIRKEHLDFFPPREQCFDVRLPSGKIISMKVCQDGGKAIMSNPNKALGEWILREVLRLDELELLTYDKLLELGIDSVVFEKHGDYYSLDFNSLAINEAEEK